MKAYKIVVSDGYTYQVTKAKPSEAEIEKVAEQNNMIVGAPEPFTIEEVKAEWETSWRGRRYLKVINEADPLGAATDTIIGSPYKDVLHTEQGRRGNQDE